MGSGSRFWLAKVDLRFRFKPKLPTINGGDNFVPSNVRTVIDDEGNSIKVPEVCAHALIVDKYPKLHYNVRLSLRATRLVAFNVIGAFF